MKKICIISANCQGAYLKALLEKSEEFSEEYLVFFFVNYKNEIVPEDLLKKCDLLIYQPLSKKWGNLSTDYLLQNISSKCLTLSVSYLTFPIYWPFFIQDPRNHVSNRFPFGPFPYGDSFILDMISKHNYSSDKILEDYFNIELLLQHKDPQKVIDEYVSKQAEIETRRDQKLLPFILENYQKVKLFESYNHPSQLLAEYQVNDILKKLGYSPLPKDKIPSLNFLKIIQQPIHPLIANYLGLEFECEKDTVYNVWNTPMTFMEYTKAYIKFDISVFTSDSISDEKIDPCNLYDSNNIAVPNKPIIFLHIPKTGGLSLCSMLSEAYGIENYVHYNSTIQLLNNDLTKEKLIMGHFHYDAVYQLIPDFYLIIWLRNPVDRVISAFEFMKSHPEVWLGKLAQGSLKEFLESEIVRKAVCELQTRLLGLEFQFNLIKFFSPTFKINKKNILSLINDFSFRENNENTLERCLERAKKCIEKAFFVGFTELFREDAEKLFSKLNKPCPEIKHINKTPENVRKRDKYSEEDIELIKNLNKYDIRLYEYARDLKNQNYW